MTGRGGRHILRSTGTLLIIVTLWSCQKRKSDLADTLGAPIADGRLDQGIGVWREPSDPLGLVPIIVVGSVEENRIVGKHIRAARYKDVYLDLHEVRCHRENSLKGGLTEQEFTFLYFAAGMYPDSAPNPRYKRFFKADPGSRYLFFLTREGGVLRSVGDVGEYSVLIASGRHKERQIGSEEIGRRIAEILLTPADGSDLNLMATTLFNSSEVAENWGSRPIAAKLLRELLMFGEPVRSQACGLLIARFFGQYDCLQAIADDPNESDGNRREALQELRAKTAERERFLEDLKDPARLTFQDFAGDSRHRLREELETLLLNPDAIQHQRACQALKRYFPGVAEPECSSGFH